MLVPVYRVVKAQSIEHAVNLSPVEFGQVNAVDLLMEQVHSNSPSSLWHCRLAQIVDGMHSS